MSKILEIVFAGAVVVWVWLDVWWFQHASASSAAVLTISQTSYSADQPAVSNSTHSSRTPARLPYSRHLSVNSVLAATKHGWHNTTNGLYTAPAAFPAHMVMISESWHPTVPKTANATVNVDSQQHHLAQAIPLSWAHRRPTPRTAAPAFCCSGTLGRLVDPR